MIADGVRNHRVAKEGLQCAQPARRAVNHRRLIAPHRMRALIGTHRPNADIAAVHPL